MIARIGDHAAAGRELALLIDVGKVINVLKGSAVGFQVGLDKAYILASFGQVGEAPALFRKDA
jgi:hypothetical protein